MARRKLAPVNRFEDGSRTSIGDFYVDKAVNDLNDAARREFTMHSEHFTAETVLTWFFDAETLRRLRLVKDLIPVTQKIQHYLFVPRAFIHIDYEKLTVPTILPVACKPDIALCQPLIEAAQKAQEIQRKYARVKHVLRWFNRNATPGAIRAYWPSALALCPDSPSMRALMDAAPTRFDTPRDIGKMLPLIRETASTVAAMELIPSDITARNRGNLWLSLQTIDEEFDGVSYTIENLVINL